MGDPAPPALRKGAQHPQLSHFRDAACVRKLRPMSVVAKRMDQDATGAAFNTGAIGVMHRRPLQRQAPVRVQ